MTSYIDTTNFTDAQIGARVLFRTRNILVFLVYHNFYFDFQIFTLATLLYGTCLSIHTHTCISSMTHNEFKAPLVPTVLFQCILPLLTMQTIPTYVCSTLP